jgi:uncharacterized membrane protein
LAALALPNSGLWVAATIPDRGRAPRTAGSIRRRIANPLNADATGQAAFYGCFDKVTRSFIKAVSWRVTGSIDTFVISLFVTGKICLAGTIATVEVITNIALYYFNERVWAIIPWGKYSRQR